MTVGEWIDALRRALELGVSPDAEIGLTIHDGAGPQSLILAMDEAGFTHDGVLSAHIERTLVEHEQPHTA